MTAGAVALVCFVYLLTGWALYQSRRHYRDRAALSARNLAQSSAINVKGILDKLDVGLFALGKEAARQLAAGGIDKKTMGAYLLAQKERLADFEGLWIADAKGDIHWGTELPAGKPVNIADRDYFRQLKSPGAARLAISQPVMGRITKAWSILVAERINRADGSLAGVGLGSLRAVDYFEGLFSKIELGERGGIELRDAQLGLIVRYPKPADMDKQIGSRVLSDKTFETFKANPVSATYTTVSARYQIEKVISYQKVAGYPLFIFISQSSDEFLAPWRQEAALSLSLLTLFTLAVALVIRAVRKRAVELLAKLGESDTKYRALVEGTNDILYSTAADGTVTYVSPQVSRYGWTPEELTGSNLASAIAAEDRERVMAEHAAAVKEGKEILSEFRILAKSGQTVWVADNGKVRRDENGQPLGTTGVLVDITERKAAEEALRETMTLTHSIVEHNQDMIWAVDPAEFGLISFNKALYAHFRDRRGLEIRKGMRPKDMFPDQEHVRWWEEAYRRALREGGCTLEYGIAAAGKTLLSSFTVLKDDKGVSAISVFSKDITDRKQSEEKYRVLFDSAQDGIALADAETGTLLDCNQELCRLVGREKEELLGRNQSVLHPENRGELEDSFIRHKRAQIDTPLEDVLATKAGDRVPVEIRASSFMLNGRRVMLGLFRDIGARKKAEAELAQYRGHLEDIVRERTHELEISRAQLAESIARYENLVQHSHSIILEWDHEGKVLFLNRWGLEFFGYKESEIVGRSVVGTIVEATDSAGTDLAAKMVKVQAAPDEFGSSENENIKKNGERVWVSWTNRAIRDAEGKTLKTLSVGIDRTSQRQGELELARYRDHLEELVSLRTEELSQKNQQLLLAAERLSVATRAAKIGIWDWDVPKNELVWDDGMYALYHIRREDFAGAYEAWARNVHPEDKARVDGDIQAALRGEREYAPEFRITWPDGEVRTIKAESQTLRGHDGKVLRMIGTNIDVTESRAAEQKLRDNELKYRALFETADDAILLFADGKWIDCNKAAGRVFGCAREQILGAHPKQFSPPTQPDGKDSMVEAPRLIGLAYEGKPQSFTWTHCRLDGTPFFAEVNLNRVDLGGKPHIQAIVRDITARRLAEEALRESNREMLQSQRDAGLGTFVLDIKTGVFAVSETMDEVLGMRRSDPHTVEAWAALVHPEDRAEMIGYLHDEVIAKKRDVDKEYRIVRPNDGEIRWLYSRGKVESDEQGAPVFIRGTSQDVTWRKASENRQALYLSVLKRLGDGEASDEVISDILAYVASSLGIEAVGIRLEHNGDFPFLATRGFTEDFVAKENYLCKRTPSGEVARDAEGHTIFQCTCGAVVCGRLGSDLPFVTAGGSLWLNSVSSLSSSQIESVTSRLVDFRGRCVDEGFESLALIPLRSKGKVIGLLHLADHRKDRLTLGLVEFLEGLGSSIAVVMQRKEAEAAKAKLEDQIRQSQKMESVGRLAGGVAHDFNNLLTGITGYAGLLRSRLAPGSKEQEDLQEIMLAADRAAELTKQLLIFSRKQVSNPAALDVNKVVLSSIKLIGRVIGEDIRLKTCLSEEPCVAVIDSGYFSQVLVNLAVNARDAMSSGGTLTISTGAAAAPDGGGADMLLLSVADTGCGMTPEILSHAFEPFFTTKKDKGTGLGLPTVYGIITQAGGQVRVKSEPGKGTTFLLYLPRASGANSAAPEPAGQQEMPSGKGETILLVEDEGQLRGLGERILKASGYTVISAAAGEEALEKAAAQARAVDAVITDLVLPGMNGRELAAELFKRGLASRFLYVSGYTDELLSRHGVLEEGLAFLNKPFSPFALAARLRQVLDEPPEKARP